MAFIEWKPDFSVGHPQLDADHKHLVELLNQLHAAWEGGSGVEALNAILDELVEYTQSHFHREETILAAESYSRLPEQKGEHHLLTEGVLNFRAMYLSGSEPHELSAEISDFLETWLMGHILEEDMKYKVLFE